MSKVIKFKSYIPDTPAHTHTWSIVLPGPPKWSVSKTRDNKIY